MARKYTRELIVMIMELIMLILIKVQASDLVMIPSSSPLQAPFPPYDHLDYNGHSPLKFCLDTKLESCEGRKKKLIPIQFNRCIHIAYANCFGQAIPGDPVYKLVKECYAFCRVFEEMEYPIYTNCLKIYHNRFIKKKHL
jgi:hypothetical protein